jgi:bifunctional N-acetylglucosamine-1-phosphate-uridyltransferase/glucosamine-1-phosphate-acetyltransferase GlmU-like protein
MIHSWKEYQHAKDVIATFDAESNAIRLERIERRERTNGGSEKNILLYIEKLKQLIVREDNMRRKMMFEHPQEVYADSHQNRIKKMQFDLLEWRRKYHQTFRLPKRNFDRVNKIREIVCN